MGTVTALGLGVAVGKIEDGADFIGVKRLDPQKMLLPKAHCATPLRPPPL